MKQDEKIAKEFLDKLNLGKIDYEPDGSVPPDFLIDNKIAVEVRRLNQHYIKDGKCRSLEEDSIPLIDKLKKVLKEYDIASHARSWFVLPSFQRPLPNKNEIIQLTKKTLDEFLQNSSQSMATYNVSKGFKITFIVNENIQDDVFVLGGWSDYDAGGFVVSELVRNLNEYIAEKSLKIKNYVYKYPIWWLVFVDHIGYARNQNELKQHISKSVPWDRILLISPSGDTYYDI